jgi:hypothetical protein
MAAENSFEFKKGEDVQIDWTIRTSLTGSVRDITGWTFSFKVKRTDADADPSLVAGTTTIVDAPNGTAATAITAAELALMDGDYVCSLWRTNVGAKACLSSGFFSVVDTPES